MYSFVLGFYRVYVGSFEDWVEQGGELEFPRLEEDT